MRKNEKRQDSQLDDLISAQVRLFTGTTTSTVALYGAQRDLLLLKRFNRFHRTSPAGKLGLHRDFGCRSASKASTKHLSPA